MSSYTKSGIKNFRKIIHEVYPLSFRCCPCFLELALLKSILSEYCAIMKKCGGNDYNILIYQYNFVRNRLSGYFERGGRTISFVKLLYIYSWYDVNQVDSNNLLLYFFIKWLLGSCYAGSGWDALDCPAQDQGRFPYRKGIPGSTEWRLRIMANID